MFVGTGFNLGFALTDVQAQLSGLLGNPVITGIVAGSLALIFGPRILSVLGRIARH